MFSRIINITYVRTKVQVCFSARINLSTTLAIPVLQVESPLTALANRLEQVRIDSAQKVVGVHANVHNNFNSNKKSWNAVTDTTCN